MYSQEKAGRNVYQVRYIELKQADTGCDQSAHVSSDRREILRVSSFHLGIIQCYLSSWTSALPAASRRLTERKEGQSIEIFYGPWRLRFRIQSRSNTNSTRSRGIHTHENMAQCIRHAYRRVHQHAKKSTRVPSLSRLHSTNVLADARVPCTRPCSDLSYETSKSCD